MQSMNTPFWSLRDWWGRWAIDIAGKEHGDFTLAMLTEMVFSGELHPHAWIRHRITDRYTLVGETLYVHGAVTGEQFEEWFPARFQRSIA